MGSIRAGKQHHNLPTTRGGGHRDQVNRYASLRRKRHTPRGGSAFAEERYYSISVAAATGEAPLVPGGPHQLACNGCIVETGRRRTAAEGARTGAAPFASKNGVTLKIGQDSEMSVYSNGESHSKFLSPVWWAAKSDKMRQGRMPKETMTWPIYGCQVSGARIDI